MGNPHDRDRVDAWLNAEVEPLAPPPGTFERIRRRGAQITRIRTVAGLPGLDSAAVHIGGYRVSHDRGAVTIGNEATLLARHVDQRVSPGYTPSPA